VDDEFRIPVSISIPHDSDGFVRRECPHCTHQFKWHDGPANEDAEQHASPMSYTCPLCGQPASADSWNTTQQVELAQRVAMPQVMEKIQDDLETMFRGMKGVTYKRGNGGDMTEFPEPLTEPDDMTIVVSPCHSYEPVKIPDDHVGPIYCLICGSAYAV
jgi:hypothetical protein